MADIYLSDLKDNVQEEWKKYVRKYRPDIAVKMDDEDNDQQIVIGEGLPNDEIYLV